jgi:hypothetical protein
MEDVMAERSRVKFNPVTKEMEIEGSESFVKATLDKLQAMLSGAPAKKVAVKKEPKAGKAAPVKADKKEPKAAKIRPEKKAKKTTKKKLRVKRVSNFGAVLTLIQGSTEGISTTELKEKAGLTERQTWGIVTRAAKEGKIRKVKRGVYVAV